MRRLSSGCPAPTGRVRREPQAEELVRTREAVHVQLSRVNLGAEARPLPFDSSVRMECRAPGPASNALEQTEPDDIAARSCRARVSIDFVPQHTERTCWPTLIEPAAWGTAGGI